MESSNPAPWGPMRPGRTMRDGLGGNRRNRMGNGTDPNATPPKISPQILGLNGGEF